MFKKRFSPEGDIFEKLQEIRKRAGISLETINKETKIPIKHLEALEEGSIKMLPDIIYTKNIIKKYLSFCNVDPRPFIAKLSSEKKENYSPKKTINTKSLIIWPRILKTSITIILIFTFILYLGFSVNKIFKPPNINIFSPTEGEIVKNSVIAVEGSADSGTKISINNEQVLLNKGGTFSKEINLQKGLNLIKISGINRYSKEKVIWRNVILQIK